MARSYCVPRMSSSLYEYRRTEHKHNALIAGTPHALIPTTTGRASGVSLEEKEKQGMEVPA